MPDFRTFSRDLGTNERGIGAGMIESIGDDIHFGTFDTESGARRSRPGI